MILNDGHISQRQRSPKSNARFFFAQSGKPEKKEKFNLVLFLMLLFCTISYVPYFKILTKFKGIKLNIVVYL